MARKAMLDKTVGSMPTRQLHMAIHAVMPGSVIMGSLTIGPPAGSELEFGAQCTIWPCVSSYHQEQTMPIAKRYACYFHHSTDNHLSDSVTTSRHGNLGTIGPISFVQQVVLRTQKPASRKTGEGDLGGKASASRVHQGRGAQS